MLSDKEMLSDIFKELIRVMSRQIIYTEIIETSHPSFSHSQNRKFQKQVIDRYNSLEPYTIDSGNDNLLLGHLTSHDINLIEDNLENLFSSIEHKDLEATMMEFINSLHSFRAQYSQDHLQAFFTSKPKIIKSHKSKKEFITNFKKEIYSILESISAPNRIYSKEDENKYNSVNSLIKCLSDAYHNPENYISFSIKSNYPIDGLEQTILQLLGTSKKTQVRSFISKLKNKKQPPFSKIRQ